MNYCQAFKLMLWEIAMSRLWGFIAQARPWFTEETCWVGVHGIWE